MDDSRQGGITDELRKLAEDPLLGYASKKTHKEVVIEIADRIDAEYKLAIANEWMRGVKYVLSKEGLAKHGLVHLPLGADGEYINIFDRVEHTNGTFTVNDMTLGIDGMWRARDFENGYTVLLAKCRHCQAPTVEDVLLDMHRRLSDVSELYDVDSDELEDEYTRIIAEYAKRLRLAGDAE